MPYKWDTKKIKLLRKFDRRVKLSEGDKIYIQSLYQEGNGIRKIARIFKNKCSRRMIQFVLFPERLKTVNFPGHWKKYYNTQENTTAQRNHGRYKQKLFKDGLMTI